MKIIVDEMPRNEAGCPFCKDGECTIDENKFCSLIVGGYLTTCDHLTEAADDAR